MRVWVLDCETTGFDPTTEKVVEIAGILLDFKPDNRTVEVAKQYQSLVNPGIPIPSIASAIHHITDEDVAEAPILDAALQPILEEQFDYVVAHNAKFDSQFLDLGDVAWLCTWKLSNVVFTDAPSFSNQVLRYHLRLPKPVIGLFPHRAMYDVEVTAALFVEVLKKSTKEDPWPGMVQVSNNPVLLKGKVGFGEHRDKLWSEVPKGYLRWMVGQSGWTEDQLYTARRWLEA